MNTIAKILAPAALVLASFSASAAGLTETDYPLDQQRYSITLGHQDNTQAPRAQTGAAPTIAGGVLEIDYPTVQPRHGAMPGSMSPSRMDAQRPVVGPTQLDLGYFA